ncbi:GDSL-type esterase/lipase family protein [Vibrio parahaemolyticus]
MYKKIFVCLISLVSFIYGGISVHFKIFPYAQVVAVKNMINPAPKRSDYNMYYYIKNSFFDANKENSDIVMIGDSITDIAEWGSLFHEVKISNRGINSDTTAGILNRMDSIYSTNAEKGFIMVGFNDFYHGATVDDVFNNYNKIIVGLINNGIKPYIQSTLLSLNPEINKKIVKLNYRLENYATKNGIVFINLNTSLSSKGSLIEDYTLDGVHLTGSAYKVWANAIKEYIYN